VLVDRPWKAGRRPNHKQKLLSILANQRHFALEQAARGVAVRYEVADGPYAGTLRRVADDVGPLVAMRPAERELREDLAALVADGRLEIVPHEGWLTTAGQFEASQKGDPPWRMDAFYRHVRQESGILMEDGRPAGGRFSFDGDNREPWPGEPPAARPPRFAPDEVTLEVRDLVERRYDRHPGRLDAGAVAATADDARALWDWARRDCLPRFGPYEDAMSAKSTTLFHTRVSALLHLHRLLPRDVVDDALGLDIPLPSKEGFVRQVLGWREFVRHVHERTDGFRDAGVGLERGGALRAEAPLPAAYWGRRSGLRCLDTVVASVWDEGYSHHIPRLMVLANLATLLDVSPRELTDWFWIAYVDAFDWVVEPNVLGMGTFALGPLFTTKPYVSGAAYIDRMSDYCADCPFDPKRDCPITAMYWAFLARNADRLSDNPRMRLPLASLRKRSGSRRERDRSVFEAVREALGRGDPIAPPDLPAG